VLRNGTVFKDGKLTAQTAYGLQQMFNADGANEVYARFNTKRLTEDGSKVTPSTGVRKGRCSPKPWYTVQSGNRPVEDLWRLGIRGAVAGFQRLPAIESAGRTDINGPRPDASHIALLHRCKSIVGLASLGSPSQSIRALRQVVEGPLDRPFGNARFSVKRTPGVPANCFSSLSSASDRDFRDFRSAILRARLTTNPSRFCVPFINLPDNYDARLVDMMPGKYKNLRMLVLDP
jgi:hypothetical protein